MTPATIRRLLIANRGEIAVRVIRACRELGITSIAVYSAADAASLHVLEADEAVPIGPAPARDSYLNLDALLAAARTSDADAVHPGYGFLSENALFAQACIDAGLVWVGPPPEAIRLMGSKIEAKRLAAELGVPLLLGYQGEDQSDAMLAFEADQIGYPLLVKASAGGGGRGMRVVRQPADLGESLASARREALAAFADDRLLLERYVERPRHIEIQVFADRFGRVIHCGERECSIQRRHQKVIEESPSPVLSADVREEMGAAAVRIAEAIGYEGAGTVEFIVDEAGRYAFLEMNTRLQVEHGVTELVTGLDLVHMQLRVAQGEPLPFLPDGVAPTCHAIECRLYAEDPAHGHLPSTGLLTRFVPPSGEGVRNDLGVYQGARVGADYDPMLAKLLVWGPTRDEAIRRARAALDAYTVEGVATNLPLLRATLAHPGFAAGDTTTTFLDEQILPHLDGRAVDSVMLCAAAAWDLSAQPTSAWSSGAWRAGGASSHHTYLAGDQRLEVAARRDEQGGWAFTLPDGEYAVSFERVAPSRLVVRLPSGNRAVTITDEHGLLRLSSADNYVELVRQPPPSIATAALHAATSATGSRTLRAPLTGVVARVAVQSGDTVSLRQTLMVLEAMKMEHTIDAPFSARVTAIHCATGDRVQAGEALIEITAD